MAYNTGYPAQRPLNGPGAPRPPPQRQFAGGPGPQQYDQQYDQYQDGYGYGYDGYAGDGGYDQGYGGQYDDRNYGPRVPPQREPYRPGPGPGGRGMGLPVNGGRGGPMPRPIMPNGQRGPPGPGRPYPPNGAMGRGRPQHVAAPNSDPSSKSQQGCLPPTFLSCPLSRQ